MSQNSRPYGRNPNRDWYLKQKMCEPVSESQMFAASLNKYDKDDVEKSPEEIRAEQQKHTPSAYPMYAFATNTLCNPLRLEEFLLWLVDPYEMSYGTGYYSPVRISPQVASYIKSHKDWDKIAVIETSLPFTQIHRIDASEDEADDAETTIISEPSAYWLWRKKDWLSVAQHLKQVKDQTTAERLKSDRLQARYIKCIAAMRKRYSAMTNEIALDMLKEWEARQAVDPMAAQFLKFYGWYEITEGE